jgi:hypothetical protein
LQRKWLRLARSLIFEATPSAGVALRERLSPQAREVTKKVAQVGAALIFEATHTAGVALRERLSLQARVVTKKVAQVGAFAHI